jgi:ligand-binding sensor domain-containing protein
MLRLKSLVPVAVLAFGVVSVSFAQPQKKGALSDEGEVHEKPNEFKIYAANSPVKAFAVLKNTLWYATDEIVVEQPMNAKTHKPYQKLGNIPSAGTRSMAVDPSGRVWIAGDNGVAVHDGKAFTSYTEDNGLPSKNATSLAISNIGEVWAGTEGGLARFSGGSWQAFTTKEGLASNKIQALVADSKGNLYIGTNKGLSVYDGSKFTNYNAKNSGSNGIEWNNVKVLAKEPNKDIIWMTDGPETQNINRFDGKNWNRWIEIQKGITSIMNDTRRTWFGHESGILRFNGEEWVSDPKMHGIPVEQVFAMYRDNDGNLWFGMEKGVMMLNNPYRR